jgi:hypothetical protein
MNVGEQVITSVDRVSEALSKSPILKGLVDGGFSLIPFVGQAVVSALDTRAFQLFEENSKLFSEEVRNIITVLDEEKIDKDFIYSSEFISLLFDTLSKNARCYEHEKTKLYANLFVNSVMYEGSKVPYKEGFLRMVDELSVDHIRILSFAYEKTLTFTKEDIEAENVFRGTISVKDVVAALGIRESRASAYMMHLARFGLLHDYGVGALDVKSGEYYRVAAYGFEFAAFLIVQTRL